ncbi:MAG: hypothetical protein FGM52_06815 [Mycobacterium sp.]|nr:hypothetical protein [Mycobacterium sp.]
MSAALTTLIEVWFNPGGFQPLSSVGVNLAITSVITGVLVAVIARRGVRHGLRYGVAAAVAVMAVSLLLAGTGLAGLSFSGWLWVTAAYCGVLAYLVVAR